MTRHLLTTTLLAAGALTVLAAAPPALAAPALDTKPSTVKTQTYTKVAQRSDRGDRHRSHNRNRNTDRGHYRQRDRNRSHNNYRDRQRSSTHRNRHNTRVRTYDRGWKDYKHRGYRTNDYRRSHRSSHKGWNNHYRGYHTPYRSRLGISFHLGTPGYSQYRWAPTAYSYYTPSYGSYGYYQSSTYCQRVTIDGWHHGHRELLSVKQCSNPWDGTYIVQGSERVIGCRY